MYMMLNLLVGIRLTLHVLQTLDSHSKTVERRKNNENGKCTDCMSLTKTSLSGKNIYIFA